MFNEMYENLAKIVIHYSLSVQKGHRVLIMANTLAKDLIQALYFEIIKVGAHPFALVDLEVLQTIFYKYASQEYFERYKAREVKNSSGWRCYL